MHKRDSASAQFAECMVASTRCPVSAAFNVRRMTSGVRISPMTSTSGFSRRASTMPCSKLGVWVGTSRCRMNDCRLAKRYSIGLSSVRMLRARFALISSSSAARVVDLPDPVGPETMTRPLAGSISLRRSGCRLQLERSLTLGARSRMARPSPRTVWKKFARKRMPPTDSDRSAEPRSTKSGHRFGPRRLCATCRSVAPETTLPTVCKSPWIRATIGVSASR